MVTSASRPHNDRTVGFLRIGSCSQVAKLRGSRVGSDWTVGVLLVKDFNCFPTNHIEQAEGTCGCGRAIGPGRCMFCGEPGVPHRVAGRYQTPALHGPFDGALCEACAGQLSDGFAFLYYLDDCAHDWGERTVASPFPDWGTSIESCKVCRAWRFVLVRA